VLTIYLVRHGEYFNPDKIVPFNLEDLLDGKDYIPKG